MGRQLARARRDRTYGADRHIGVRPPGLGHGQVDAVGPCADRHGPQVDDPVRQHRNHRDAVGRGVQRHPGGVADAIGGLVQRHRQAVRRVGARRHRPPSRLERDRAFRPVRAGHDQLVAAPVHRHGQRRRRGGGQRQVAVGDTGAAGDRLPAPVAGDRVPLIIRVDTVQHPLDPARARGQVGAQRDDVERRLGPLGHGVAGEIGTDAQRAARRQDQAAGAAFDGAAGAFAHGQGQLRLVRAGGLAQRRGQIDAGGKAALGVGAAGGHPDHLGGAVVVVAAKAIAVPAGQGVRRDQAQFALDRQVGGGGAEQPAGGDPGLDRLRRWLRTVRQGQVKGDAFGTKILDQHRGRGERRAPVLDPQVDPPGPARRCVRDLHGQRIAAVARRLRHQPRVFHPVGAQHHGGQRQPVQRLRPVVADQDRGMRGLARAIGAPVGGDKDVDRRGGRAALDPPVGQVEFGVDQRQECAVGNGFAPPGGGGDDRGFRGARAAGHPGVKARDALVVGARRRQHGVPARDQRDLDPRTRRGIGQAAHRDGQPVGPRPAGQSQVRDHEPLRRGRAAVRGLARHAGGQRIDAGGQLAGGGAQVQPGGDLGVHRMGAAAGGRGHVGLAGPDLVAHLRGKDFRLPVVQRRGKDLVAQRADDVAVRHPVQRQVHGAGVHGAQRQPLIPGRRQHIGPPAEPRLGAAVADIHGQVDPARQHLSAGRGQAGAQGQRQRRAAGDPGHAQLAALGLDRHGGIGQRDKGAIVGVGGQFVRKHRAGARFGRVAVHLIVGDAKAVAFRERFDLGVQGGVARAAVVGGMAQRRQPVPAAIQPFGHVGPAPQRGDRGAGVAQPGVQRGRLCGDQHGAVVVGGHGGVQHRLRQRVPVGGGIGCRDDRPQPAHLARQVPRACGGTGLGAQGGRVLAGAGIQRTHPLGLGEGGAGILRADPAAGGGQPCRGRGLHGRVGRHHQPGQRPRIAHRGARLRLGKAGARSRIVGQRPAGRIGQALLHAGLLGRLKDRRQVTAGQVGVGLHHHASLGQGGVRRGDPGQRPGKHRGQRQHKTPGTGRPRGATGVNEHGVTL